MNKEADLEKNYVELYLQNASKDELREISALISLGQTNVILNRAKDYMNKIVNNPDFKESDHDPLIKKKDAFDLNDDMAEATKKSSL